MNRPWYPLYLDLRGRLCVVLGGGKVAERKVRALLASGASVRVVSPEATKGISRLADGGRIELVRRGYRQGDLAGARLVFAATGRQEVDREVRAESEALGIPLNVADNPGLCDFFVPSVVRKGPVMAAISTSGLLPMLSKRLRREIESCLGADYAAYARRVGAFRRYLIENVGDGRRRRRIMQRVGEADFREVASMGLGEMKKRFLTGDEAP